VTADIKKTVGEYRAGKVEFRNDPTGIVHAVVGKVSFDAPKLADNIRAFIDHVVGMAPASVRGQYVKSISICATMTPGVMVAA
jgi:large subunit ribosomal protein L1